MGATWLEKLNQEFCRRALTGFFCKAMPKAIFIDLIIFFCLKTGLRFVHSIYPMMRWLEG